MNCTEEEAAEKWCPMIRLYDGGKSSYNYGANIGMADCVCIASECMMWVWNDGINSKGHCGLTNQK